MQIKVFRYDPLLDTESHFDTFEVPVAAHWTVMDVLDYISEYLDSTLAYFKHGACDHGICGRCALRINGKIKLACSTDISKENTLELAPMTDKILRDLVVVR